MKIYIERKIESEKDLPKESGVYYVEKRDYEKGLMHFDPDAKGKLQEYDISCWIEFARLWLEPVEISDEAEEILLKHLNNENLYSEKNIEENKDILQAMKEFAAQEVAKDRAEHLLLDVKTQPSDEDILEYAESKDSDLSKAGLNDNENIYYKIGFVDGAKAALSGEIKKKEK